MIYILEFSQPLHHAKFYMGYCEENRLQARLAEHQRGEGARICAAAVAAGRQLRLVATMPGDRAVERQLKRRKNTPRLVEQLRRRGAI